MKSHWKYSSSFKTFSGNHHSTSSSPARKRHQDPSPRRKLMIQPRSHHPSQRNLQNSLIHLKSSLPEISSSFKHFFSPHIKTYIELSSSPLSFDLRGKSIEKDLNSAQKLVNFEKLAENKEKIREDYNKLAKKNISKVKNERKDLRELSPGNKKSHPKGAEFFFEVKKGNEEAVFNFLLVFPELVKEIDSTGQTSLHWAVRRKHLNIVKLLLRSGACLMAKDIVGRVPEDIAKNKGMEEIYEVLSLERKNKGNNRALNQVSPHAAKFVDQLVSLSKSKQNVMKLFE
jgi:ankyrin repeat protein